MRIGRKFNFYGVIVAYIERRSLLQSPLENLWVVRGKLCYLQNGKELPLEAEPIGDTDAAAAVVVNDSEDDGVECVDDDTMPVAEMLVKAPQQCTIVVRDTNGRVPVAHAGMFFSAQLTRRGLYKSGAGLLSEMVDMPDAVVAGADFREHVYEVQRCKSIKCEREISQKVLIDALGYPDPLVLLNIGKLVHDSRAQLANAKVRSKSFTQKVESETTWRRTQELKRSSKSIIDTLTEIYAMQRTRLATFFGLLNALPEPLRTKAAIAFVGFYQMRSSMYIEAPELALQISQFQLSGSDVLTVSAPELFLLARFALPGANAILSLEQRLYFGALIGIVSLADYKSVIGQWSGVYWNDALLGGDKPPPADMKKWCEKIGDALQIASTPKQQAVASIAWWLYNAAQTLLQQNQGSTVFALTDIVDKCTDRARFTSNKRMAARFAPERDYVAIAVELLVQMDVWRSVPTHTIARLFVGTDAAAADMFSTARVIDVSARIAYCAVKTSAVFVSCGLRRDDWYEHLAIDRTVVFYCGAPPLLVPKGMVWPVALQTPLALERYTEDAFSEARILIQCAQRVLLIDAHLLDEVDLLRFFVLIGAEQINYPMPSSLLIAGDVRFYSPFSTLALAARRAAQEQQRFLDLTQLDAAASSEPVRCSDVLQTGALADMPVATIDPAMLQSVLYRAAGNDRSACAAAAQTLERMRCVHLETLGVQNAMMQKIGSRWILVASTYKSAASAVEFLIQTVVDKTGVGLPISRASKVRDELTRLAQNPRLLASTLLFVAPYIGFRNRCVEVQTAYLLQQRSPSLETGVFGEDCIRIDPLTWEGAQMLSLDSDAVLLQVGSDQFGDDHRDCCRTWAANILRVANHRAEICSQSLPMARDALPFDSRVCKQPVATVLLFGTEYTLDAAYYAAVRASYYPRHFDVLCTPNTIPFAVGLEKRQGRPRTCVADLFTNLINGAS